MKKHIFMQYNNELILEMLKSNLYGTSANFLTMIVVGAFLYNYLPNNYLILFFFIHILLALLRLYNGKQLFTSINNNISIEKNLTLYIIILAITAVSYGTITFLGILYNIPDINIFLIGAILIIISAGALSTLASVYIVFLSFMFFTLTPFIFALLFHGTTAFNAFAIIILAHMIGTSTSGYRMYLKYQSTFLLKEKFKTIFDNSFDGIALIKNKHFIECNQSFLRIFGYTSIKDFLNTDTSSHMPLVQDDGQNSMKKMIQMRKKTNQGTHTFEWKYLKKNGKTFYAEVTLSLIFINNEKVIHGIWRDITYSKEIQDEIVSLNKNLQEKVQNEVAKNREKDKAMFQQSRLAQMGEMISMIAHQWRQPLTAISATSANLTFKAKLDTLDNNTVVELGEKISQYAQHLSHTIDDFRGFFQANKNILDTTYKELIDSVLSIVEISLTNKNIQLKQELHSEVIFSTYPSELKQVILNLIKNAEDILLEKEIKNPIITIETQDNILRVKDNAGGVPTDIIEKIFDPYFSTKTAKNGTGLGLYMSKTIIREHCSGELRVYNDASGAVFEIKLPIKRS